MQNIDAILDNLREAKYLSKIDVERANVQVLSSQKRRKYTAFSVPGSGLLQFKRMLFGLCNVPMTFKRLVDLLFRPELEPHTFQYWTT